MGTDRSKKYCSPVQINPQGLRIGSFEFSSARCEYTAFPSFAIVSKFLARGNKTTNTRSINFHPKLLGYQGSSVISISARLGDAISMCLDCLGYHQVRGRPGLLDNDRGCLSARLRPRYTFLRPPLIAGNTLKLTCVTSEEIRLNG